MQGDNGLVCGKEAEQLLIKWYTVPLALELFIGVMHALVLDCHPLSLGLALHPVPHLHLLGNVVEHIPAMVPFEELVLGLLFTLDGHEIPPMAPVV